MTPNWLTSRFAVSGDLLSWQKVRFYAKVEVMDDILNRMMKDFLGTAPLMSRRKSMTLLIGAGGRAELVAEPANPGKLICIVITHV
ncbi:Uncharacterised protein [uncultured archaeon]|nr:Uncharacterised protein [uncultured archaeon]